MRLLSLEEYHRGLVQTWLDCPGTTVLASPPSLTPLHHSRTACPSSPSLETGRVLKKKNTDSRNQVLEKEGYNLKQGSLNAVNVAPAQLISK